MDRSPPCLHADVDDDLAPYCLGLYGSRQYSCAELLCRGRSAEKSFTHRHLCEFTGLDLEMAIDEHYNEVLDVLDRLFVYMFSGLRSKYGGAPAAHCAFLLCSSLPYSSS